MTNASEVATQLSQLVMLVRGEKERVQQLANKGDRVSCIIEHSVTFAAGGDVEKSHLKYGLSTFSEGKMLPPTYQTKDLEGEGGIYDVLTDLISSAAADCNLAIDVFAMNCDVMYADDITGRIENFIIGNLQGLGIEDGYSVTTEVVAGGISKITITVA